MTHLTCPISFGGYTGTAYHHDHKWWVAPRPVSEFLGIDWSGQRKVILASAAISCVDLKSTQVSGQARATLMLQTADIGVWLAGISPSKVSQSARPMLIEMQRRLRDAIEAQVNEAFGIPSPADLEALINAPIAPHLDRDWMIEARTEMLAKPGVASAAQLFKLGLPGTKTGALLGRSSYWALKQRRELEAVGVLVPRLSMPPANDPGQPDLFASASHGE